MDITKTIRSILDKLRDLREKAGFGQKEFADTADLDKNRYGELENKASNCTLETFLLICIYLDKKPWEVLFAVLHKDWEKQAKAIRKKRNNRKK